MNPIQISDASIGRLQSTSRPYVSSMAKTACMGSCFGQNVLPSEPGEELIWRWPEIYVSRSDVQNRFLYTDLLLPNMSVAIHD